MPALLTSRENTRAAVRSNREGHLTERQLTMVSATEPIQTRVGVRRWRWLALIIGGCLIAWFAFYQASVTQVELRQGVEITGAALVLFSITIMALYALAFVWSIFNVPETPDDIRARLERQQSAGYLPIRSACGMLRFRHLTLSRKRKLYSVVLESKEFTISREIYEKLRLYSVQGEFTAFYLRRPFALLSIAPSRVLKPDGEVEDATLLRGDVIRLQPPHA